MESSSERSGPDRVPTAETASRRWSSFLAAAGLGGLTLITILIYSLDPQGPRDLVDRVSLAVHPDAYGPNVRLAESRLGRADRARLAGADSLAEALAWKAAEAFRRAAAGAETPRRRLAANDRAADTYLELGRAYLERGRGGVFGLGRRPVALARAERVAACVVGMAPTQRRVQIDAFVQEIETVLERPIAGRCP